MATVQATFITVQNTTSRGTEIAAPSAAGALGLQNLTSSGTAADMQRGGVAFAAPSAGYVMIETDGDVRVASDGDAAAGTSPVGVLCKSGRTTTVAVREGDALSVIDA